MLLLKDKTKNIFHKLTQISETAPKNMLMIFLLNVYYNVQVPSEAIMYDTIKV